MVSLIAAAPPLPPRRIPRVTKPPLPIDTNNDSSDNSDDDGDHSEFLEKVIRDGIQKATTSENRPAASESSEPAVAVLPKNIIKENPVRMFRKGGHSLMDMVSDETNRFNVEDSPCSFSVISALSDLTFNSHREHSDGNQHSSARQSVDNHSLSSLSIASEDDGDLLNRVRINYCFFFFIT